MARSNSNPAADTPTLILHIAERVEYERQLAAGWGYVDPSLSGEGFIHCSTVEQVLIPANERFAGRAGLILLVIEASALSSPLVYEDSYASGTAFPHIYGPIDLEAIVGVVDFLPRSDGSFDLPPEVEAFDQMW